MKTIFWSRISFVIEDKVVTIFPTPNAPINTINSDSVRIFKYGCQNSAKKYYNNCSWIVVFDFRVSNPHSPICRPRLWPCRLLPTYPNKEEAAMTVCHNFSIYSKFFSYKNSLNKFFWKIAFNIFLKIVSSLIEIFTNNYWKISMFKISEKIKIIFVNIKKKTICHFFMNLIY